MLGQPGAMRIICLQSWDRIFSNSPSLISSLLSTSGPAAEPAGAPEVVENNGSHSKLDSPYKFSRGDFICRATGSCSPHCPGGELVERHTDPDPPRRDLEHQRPKPEGLLLYLVVNRSTLGECHSWQRRLNTW